MAVFFTIREIEDFNGRIQNVLKDNKVRGLLKEFLQEIADVELTNILEIWENANSYLTSPTTFDENAEKEMMDQIVEKNGIDYGRVCAILEKNDKLIDIKHQCAEILKDILNDFIEHLKQNHVQ